MFNEGDKHINTDYTLTGWILCVLPHIGKDLLKNAQNNHQLQVNTVINIFVCWII